MKSMTNKTAGRTVGALILLAFVFYGGGSFLVDAGSGAPAVLADAADNQTQILAGGLLMLINCAVVAGIGVVAFGVLNQRHPTTAFAYLVTRVFEAVLLAVGVVFTLLLVPLGREFGDTRASEGSVLAALARVAQDGGLYAYWTAMTGLALGSLLFCRVLLRARLVPRLIAIWGLIGYAILAIGGMLELLGYGVGLALSVPGGLFEVALGILLVARGFPAPTRPDQALLDLDLSPADLLRSGAPAS